MTAMADSGVKNRLEHGLWIDEVDRAFREWRAAPNSEKPALLLHGMVLTWAENWRLTHAEDFSPPVHTFIARSLAAQTLKSASEREAADQETRRRDKVYQQILLLMALFVIVVLGPNTIKLYFRQFELEDVVPPKASADAGERAAVAGSVVTQDPMPEPQPVPAPNNWPPAKLMQAAATKAAAGDRRSATLFALEALGSDAGDNRANADIERRALSTIAGLTHRGTPMPQAASVRPETANFRACSASRFAAITGPHGAFTVDMASQKAPVVALSETATILAGAIDRACERVVTASPDYELSIVSLDDGRVVKRLGMHDAPLVGSRFSRDGSRVVSISRDAVGKVWDTATGQRIASFRSQAQMFNGVAVNATGTRAVTWSDEKAAELWDATNGKLLGSLAGHNGQVSFARFSQDGKRLLTTSYDGTALIWDVSTKAIVASLSPKGNIVDAWLSAGGRSAIIRLDSDRVEVWSIDNNVVTTRIDAAARGLLGVVESPDAKRLAVLHGDGSVAVWDLAKGRALIEVQQRGNQILAATFAADGGLAALTSTGLSTWSLAYSLSEATVLSNAAGQCWTTAERTALKLDPERPSWCQGQAEADKPVPLP